MFNLVSVVDSLRNRNTAAMLCLSAIRACVSEIVSVCVFRGEVGRYACYGMS